jgi:hypothetical protein
MKSGSFTAAELIGTGQQQFSNVFHCAHATADCDRHEAVFGRAGDDVENRVPAFVAGGDVEEGQLVGAGCVIGDGRLNGVAGIDEVDEIDALYDAAAGNVEAGNDTGLQGHERLPFCICPQAMR